MRNQSRMQHENFQTSNYDIAFGSCQSGKDAGLSRSITIHVVVLEPNNNMKFSKDLIMTLLWIHTSQIKTQA